MIPRDISRAMTKIQRQKKPTARPKVPMRPEKRAAARTRRMYRILPPQDMLNNKKKEGNKVTIHLQLFLDTHLATMTTSKPRLRRSR